MLENSSNSAMRPLTLVGVGLIELRWTPLSVAVTVDVASEEVCGIGVHADPEMARVHAVCDAVRDSGWSFTHGRPVAFACYHDRCPDADRVAAQLCGSQLRNHFGQGVELMKDMTKALADHLTHAAKRGRSFERLYCEAISWAIETNKFRGANPMLPALDWSEMDDPGELPAIVNALELPITTSGCSEPGGQVEVKGERFHHPWLETFSQQAYPSELVYAVCRFPGNDNELWVVDDGGCFAATRVLEAEETVKAEVPTP